ncbi:MAG TPA: RnfABCDGE type electron transport complex subunit G [Longimicrobiales bacterium]|nr:RnfABCDGE type electron transport complex subunit G [Longimicrobiales bacterium]
MNDERLPVVESDRLPSGGGPASAGRSLGGGADGGGSAPQRVDTSARRLVATLALAGALAGLVIVLVHQWTEPRIQAHRARVLREAVYEVLAGPERYERAFLVDGAFTTRTPAADTSNLERVYVGFDAAGRPTGIAVTGEAAGFQDVIRLIFGFDPSRGEVLGMKVLESKETPGLGDKIEKDSAFVAGFRGAAAPLVGVKAANAGGAEGEVDMITGATISSRAVIDVINRRLDTLGAPMTEFWERAVIAEGSR